MHQKLCLSPETLYLTVSIFDRFLSQECIVRVEAKLVGMCAMHIASKYEEVYKPLVRDNPFLFLLFGNFFSFAFSVVFQIMSNVLGLFAN